MHPNVLPMAAIDQVTDATCSTVCAGRWNEEFWSSARRAWQTAVPVCGLWIARG